MRDENIPILCNKTPIRIGKEKGDAFRIAFIDVKTIKNQETGGLSFAPIPGTEWEMTVDGVITAIGEDAGPDRIGYDFLETRRRHIAGDAAGEIRTVTTAAASGKRAAMEIDAALVGRIEIPTGAALRHFRQYIRGTSIVPTDPVTYSQINTDYFMKEARVPIKRLDLNERVGGFKEVSIGYTAEETQSGASRCFVCGSCIGCKVCETYCPDFSIAAEHTDVKINYDYCKGCGICVRECPRGVIEIGERED